MWEAFLSMYLSTSYRLGVNFVGFQWRVTESQQNNLSSRIQDFKGFSLSWRWENWKNSDVKAGGSGEKRKMCSLWLFPNHQIRESRTFASEMISSNWAWPISLDVKEMGIWEMVGTHSFRSFFSFLKGYEIVRFGLVIWKRLEINVACKYYYF